MIGELELISVHVPKCAGISLREILTRTFGSESIYLDYDDRPADPSSPMYLDPEGYSEHWAKRGPSCLEGKKVVHGHFNIRKYDDVRARWRITFLREPIDRAISHYFFWLTLPRHGHLLHNYVLDNKLSFEDFVRLPMIRGFYGSVFFADVDMEQFDFIGFHDRLEGGLCSVQSLLAIQQPIPRCNANTSSNYHIQREQLLSDARLLQRVRESLKADLVFYENVLAKWS